MVMKFSIGQDGIVNGNPLIGDNLTIQNYARTAVYAAIEELGFEVQEEWEMDDNSLEITVR
tara:strand:+ start:181 stop:363 length:183 start_codon:yes stop_codon:yes gene_type:complete